MPSKSNRPALPGLPPVRTASADTRDVLEMIRGSGHVFVCVPEADR